MAARREIQPASSSDDDSQSSESAEDRRMTARMEAYDSDGSGSAEELARPVSKFDDLPTDDSESDSDDDSDEDDQANIPLSERVASRALQGRRYHTENQDEYDGKRQRAQRKSRAIELASQRLRDAKKKSAKPNNNDSDDSSAEEEPKRKRSKHAPTEMSSKRRDFYSRKTDLNSSGIGVSIGANKYKPRDPRMVSLSGHLDADLFEKRYGFLDEVQEQEIDMLKKRVSAWKTTGKKGQRLRKKLGMTQGGSMEDDQEELKRLTQERAERKRSQMAKAAKRSVKKKIREEVASGKRGAYYPKRNELRRMEMEAKFEEIRKSGGDEAVDKAIAKRRKKNVQKSHKMMPSHLSS
jgi:ribosomal RNA-processing protein 36